MSDEVRKAAEQAANLEGLRAIDTLPATTDISRYVLTQERASSMLWKANVMIKSGFLPDRFKKASEVVTVMMMAEELNIPHMAALRSMYVVKGQPACFTRLMMGLIQSSGKLQAMSIKTNNKAATCSMTRTNGLSFERTFTEDDARAAGLLTGPNAHNYKSYPSYMYQWRAVSAVANLLFADVLHGLLTVEEMGLAVDVRGGELVVADGAVAPVQSLAAAVDQAVDVEHEEIEEAPKPAPKMRAPAPKAPDPAPNKAKERAKAAPVANQADKDDEVDPRELRQALARLFSTMYPDSKNRVLSATEIAAYNNDLRAHQRDFAYWTKLVRSVEREVAKRLAVAADPEAAAPRKTRHAAAVPQPPAVDVEEDEEPEVPLEDIDPDADFDPEADEIEE